MMCGVSFDCLRRIHEITNKVQVAARTRTTASTRPEVPQVERVRYWPLVVEESA